MDFKTAGKKVRSLLKDATKKRMISDVPLGVFLSGGHDSTVITGLMSEIYSSPVKTFSAGFKEKEFSELKYAKIVSKKFNTDHHEFVVNTDYKDLIPEIVRSYSQPYADCSALPSYCVAKMTKKHVKVALNGDAKDENYAGYLRYRALKISRYVSGIYKLLPEKAENILINLIPLDESVSSKSMFRYLHRFLKPLKKAPAVRNTIWQSYFTENMKDFIYTEDMKNEVGRINSYRYIEKLFNEAPADNNLDRAMYTDLRAYLPEDLMVKMDIATMANSLETRSPFLDYRLVEFNASLPSEWKLKGFNNGKYILK